MRLQILEDGHRPLQKAFLRLIKAIAGDIPGPIALMSYRKELFGKGLSLCFEEAMRGATSWGQGETELFAAFVSHTNACAY